VLDANLPKRLATQLTTRSRTAVSASDIGIAEFKDPQLLRELARRYETRPWILVTGDDAMPAEHGPVIHETVATVATIHPEFPAGYQDDSWRRDIVHRWVHSFQLQPDGSVRRYGASGWRPWTPRRRHIRAIASGDWEPWRQRSDITETGERPRSPSDSHQEVPRLPGLE
jgi:hypothetical protein